MRREPYVVRVTEPYPAWCGKKTFHPVRHPYENAQQGRGPWYLRPLPNPEAIPREKRLARVADDALLHEWDSERNMPLTPRHVFATAHVVVWWVCSKEGHRWTAEVHSRTKPRGATGCPLCAASGPERLLHQLLREHVGEFVFNLPVRIPDRVRPLHVDFALGNASGNDIWVEFDGPHHFRPNPKYGGIPAFRKQLLRDQDKERYAEEHGIILFRIHHHDFVHMATVVAHVERWLRHARTAESRSATGPAPTTTRGTGTVLVTTRSAAAYAARPTHTREPLRIFDTVHLNARTCIEERSTMRKAHGGVHLNARTCIEERSTMRFAHGGVPMKRRRSGHSS